MKICPRLLAQPSVPFKEQDSGATQDESGTLGY